MWSALVREYGTKSARLRSHSLVLGLVQQTVITYEDFSFSLPFGLV